MIDATAAAQVGIVLLSGGQVVWLARAYAVGLIWSAVLKAAALVRFRFLRPDKRAYRVPLNVRLAGREWPLGLMILAALPAVSGVCVLISLDPPSIAGTALLAGLTVLLASSERVVAAATRDARARRWTSSSCCRRRMSICGRWRRGPGISWCRCASRMR